MGTLGQSGGSVGAPAAWIVRICDCPKAGPRLAQGAHPQTDLPGVTLSSDWSEPFCYLAPGGPMLFVEPQCSMWSPVNLWSVYVQMGYGVHHGRCRLLLLPAIHRTAGSELGAVWGWGLCMHTTTSAQSGQFSATPSSPLPQPAWLLPWSTICQHAAIAWSIANICLFI